MNAEWMTSGGTAYKDNIRDKMEAEFYVWIFVGECGENQDIRH